MITGMGKLTKTGKLKKANEARNITIKSLIHRICTPTTAEKRLQAIDSFFKAHATDEFNHEELMHVWKGLFYAIWYSEMEKGCEKIMASIVDKSKNKSEMILCAFETLAIEWFGIDSIRLDKFMYFVRQMTRPIFEMVAVESKPDILISVLHLIENRLGLILHVCDVIVDEMFKLDHSKDIAYIMRCINPFIDLIRRSVDEELSKHIVKEVLMTTLEKLEDEDSPKTMITFKYHVTKRFDKLLGGSLKRVNRDLIERTKQVFALEEEEISVMKKKRKCIPSQVERNGLIYKRSKIPIPVD